MEEQQGERDDILPVVLNYRYKGTAIAGPQVRFIKFRHHLTGDVAFPVNMQDFPFQ